MHLHPPGRISPLIVARPPVSCACLTPCCRARNCRPWAQVAMNLTKAKSEAEFAADLLWLLQKNKVITARTLCLAAFSLLMKSLSPIVSYAPSLAEAWQW